MIRTHRAILHWERWLTQRLGQHVLDVEQQFLSTLSMKSLGKYALLIGVPGQHKLLKFKSIAHQALLSPLINKNDRFFFIESEFYELPITSASIDLVLLPHTLEYTDYPRKLLSEACRIVKPEGHIIIFGFNPYSLWGLNKIFVKKQNTPWSNHFIPVSAVKKWLSFADFELVAQNMLFFRPPFQVYDTLYQKLKIMEWLGNYLWTPLGGIYMLMAKAKVIPMTPIKLHWKQELSGIPVSINGISTRNL